MPSTFFPGNRGPDAIIEWVSEQWTNVDTDVYRFLVAMPMPMWVVSRVPVVAAANVRTVSAAIGGHNPARENYQGYVHPTVCMTTFHGFVEHLFLEHTNFSWRHRKHSL